MAHSPNVAPSSTSAMTSNDVGSSYASQIGRLRDRRKQKGRSPATGGSTAPSTAPPKTYNWGDGKVHSIPKAQHKTNVAANDPNTLLAALTPNTLDANTQAAVRQKYQPQEDILAGQQRVSGQQQQNITDWFQQYRDAITTAEGQSAAYDKGVQDAITA